MYHSITQAFTAGYDPVVLIGSDTPDLPAPILEQAYTALESADVILGPALDGGYYLVGCNKNRFPPAMFTGIPWSTSDVLTTTLHILKHHHRTVALLPTHRDIDTPDDLADLIRRHHKTAFKSSHPFTYLVNHHLMEEHLR